MNVKVEFPRSKDVQAPGRFIFSLCSFHCRFSLRRRTRGVFERRQKKPPSELTCGARWLTGQLYQELDLWRATELCFPAIMQWFKAAQSIRPVQKWWNSMFLKIIVCSNFAVRLNCLLRRGPDISLSLTPLEPSKLSQMAELPPFCGWITLHFMYSYHIFFIHYPLMGI